MTSLIRLLTIPLLLLSVSLARSAPLPQAPPDVAEVNVLLRLNGIETAKLMEHYSALVKRELALQDSVRACMKSGDTRLPEYQQALQEAQDDLSSTKKRLIALEVEKLKLNERLGRKVVSDPATESTERILRALDQMLERLDSIEKRLEKLERRR